MLIATYCKICLCWLGNVDPNRNDTPEHKRYCLYINNENKSLDNLICKDCYKKLNYKSKAKN